MAEYNVSFLRYSQSNFDALTTKNPYTFYLVESTNSDGGFHYDLYLGNERLDNSAEVVAAKEQLNALINLKANQSKVDELEAKIKAITGEDGSDVESLAGLKTYVDSQVASLQGADSTLESKIDAVSNTVGDSTKGLVKSVADLQVKDTALESKIDNEITRATNKETELNTAITNLTTNKANQAALDTTNANVEKKADKTYVDTELGKKADQSEITRLAGLIDDEEARSEDFEDRISTMENFWEAAEVDEEGKNVIDTLVEIQKHITDDISGASTMMELITENKNAHEQNAKDIAQVRTDFAAADTALENSLKPLISTKVETETFNAHVQEFTTHKTAFETYKTTQKGVDDGQDAKIQALEAKDIALAADIEKAKTDAIAEATRLDGEVKGYVNGKVETINNDISGINQALSTKAESNTVTSEVSRLEGLISQLDTSVKDYCYSKSHIDSTFATITSLNTVDGRVTALDTKFTEALTWKLGQ